MKIKASYIIPTITVIEEQISSGNHSNSLAMSYFAMLSHYYNLGGSMNLKNRIDKHIINHFESERSKQVYINIAKTYIFGGITFLKINSHINMDKVVKSLRPHLMKNNIAIKFTNNKFKIIGRNTKTVYEYIPNIHKTPFQFKTELCNLIVEAYDGEYPSLEESYYNRIEQIKENINNQRNQYI